jgi:maleylpyruvate isomerase
LLIVHRGTAYLSHRLAELSDRDLEGQTLLPDWDRRHVIAHTGYNALALCRLLDWAATGVETPMYESAEQRGREITEGATLNPGALRNFFAHATSRLAEKWRQLPDAAWGAQVRTAQGRTVPAEETLWMRTREVWIHAVDLANGGRFGDFPDVVLDSLLIDIVSAARVKGHGAGLVLNIDDRPPLLVGEGQDQQTTVSGSLAAVTRWAAGRGAIEVHIEGDRQPPPWL